MKNHHLVLWITVSFLLFPGHIFLQASIPKGKITQLSTEPNIQQLKSELLHLINRERKNRGMNNLKLKREMDIIAQKHSLKMAKARKMSHYFPAYKSLKKRMIEANLFFILVGENLAFSDFPAAEFIHDGLMESPEHRKNILQPKFTHCGLGIVRTDKNIYVTQIYAQLFNGYPESEIEFRLKEDLEQWFVKSFNYRFVFHRQSQNKVRQIAQRNLTRRPVKSSARYNTDYFQLSIIYPDLEVIKNRIKEEMTKFNLEALSVGIAVGRNKTYPGGAHSVTAFLIGRYFQNMSSDELSKIMLQTINQQRTKIGLSVLKVNPRLSQRAQKILRTRYRRVRNQFKTSSKSFTLTFPLINPRSLPDEVGKFIRKQCHEIGIGFVSKLKKNSSRQNFRVCIILTRK
jgi:uncharacterized protein YkwD